MTQIRDIIRHTRRHNIPYITNPDENIVDDKYLIDEYGNNIYHDGTIDDGNYFHVDHDIEIMTTYNNERLFRIITEANKIVQSRQEPKNKTSHRPHSFRLQHKHKN